MPRGLVGDSREEATAGGEVGGRVAHPDSAELPPGENQGLGLSDAHQKSQVGRPLGEALEGAHGSPVTPRTSGPLGESPRWNRPPAGAAPERRGGAKGGVRAGVAGQAARGALGSSPESSEAHTCFLF